MAPSSTDTEVLCSPPNLNKLQEAHDYEVVDNNTERRKRNTQHAKSKKETPKPTEFKVLVTMGNRQLSPGKLVYEITSGAPLESSVRLFHSRFQF